MFLLKTHETGGGKGVATVAMLGKLSSVALKDSEDFQSWYVRVKPSSGGRESLERDLFRFGYLKKKWTGFKKNSDELSFSARKDRVIKEQLDLMKDDPEVKRLQSSVDHDLYPFGYDETFDEEPDSSCNLDLFQVDSKVIVKFTLHAMNFKFPDYGCRMQALYLVTDDSENPDEPMFEISKKKRRDPDG